MDHGDLGIPGVSLRALPELLVSSSLSTDRTALDS